MNAFEEATARAIYRQERLLHIKTLELLLGSMVRQQGVTPVRLLLLAIADDLSEFDKGS